MVNGRTKLTLLVVVISLSLSLLSTPALADNGLSKGERAKVMNIITEEYNNLPNETLDFADSPAVTFDGVKVMPYSNLALSEANLADGIVVALLSYEGKATLLIAKKLPEDIEAGYASGLILLSSEKAVFVAEANLISPDKKVTEGLDFVLKEEKESDNLTLKVTGSKYLLRTSIPKSL